VLLVGECVGFGDEKLGYRVTCQYDDEFSVGIDSTKLDHRVLSIVSENILRRPLLLPTDPAVHSFKRRPADCPKFQRCLDPPRCTPTQKR
jgi:hypothetical protein